MKLREKINSIELHAFGDARRDGVSSAVNADFHQPSGTSQGLMASQIKMGKARPYKPNPPVARVCSHGDNQ